jgi:hypothetical protein
MASETHPSIKISFVAWSLFMYPNAFDGCFTNNSPGSEGPANVPSSLTIFATTPGINCPAEFKLSLLRMRGIIEIVVAVSVIPAIE